MLLLTDPIDEYVVSHLSEFKGKKLKAADKGEGSKADESDEQKKDGEAFKPLLEAIKTKLPEVKDVRLTHRLKESAAVLVADDYAPTAHMERLMKRMGQQPGFGGDPDSEMFKRTLELNPDNPAVQKLRSIFDENKDDARVESYAKLFLDQAQIAEGTPVGDPAAFARRVNALLVG